ncbi:MAG: alpha/beta fold hydrolase [Candidatus Baltobacteraceae bacterium]
MEAGRLRIDRLACELEFARADAARPGHPTLIFLHEGLGSLALWRNFPEALAARTGCGALVYSRYGNGFSTPLSRPRSPQYMHDEALVTLPLVLAELAVEEPVLVGQSDGGSIAAIFAGEHPHAVRGLVLEAPHLFVEELSLHSIAAIRGEYERTDLRDRMTRYHADVDRTFYGWNDVWLAAEFRDWNIEEYASRIRAPVLAIQGLDDEYGTPAQLDALARRAPAPVDRLLLARCGHAPHVDRRRYVEAAIAEWLDERV